MVGTVLDSRNIVVNKREKFLSVAYILLRSSI